MHVALNLVLSFFVFLGVGCLKNNNNNKIVMIFFLQLLNWPFSENFLSTGYHKFRSLGSSEV